MTARGFSSRFNIPFNTAKPASALVPYVYDVALAGVGYMRDTGVQNGHVHASIGYLTKFLTSPVFGSPAGLGEVGENSLNPDVNWRRSTSSWHKGAGQPHFDLSGSDRERFNTSKGVDVWTRGALTLLPDTTKTRASANTNLSLILAGGYAYLADGSALLRSTDGTTWVDAGVTTAIAGVCSDGATVYVALPDGVYSGTVGGSSVTLYSDLVADGLAYVKGRLMASAGNKVYNLVYGPLTTPTGLTVTGIATAARTTAYAVGDLVLPATPNSHYYKCTTAGTSGGSEPTWPTSSGGTVTDGTVVWTEQGATATYGYQVSAVGPGGVTLACAEVTAIGAGTLSASAPMTLAWTAVIGADSYKVYGRTSGAELFIGDAASNTFTDDGTATPSGALPAANTTTTAPNPLYTHPTGDWSWAGFGTGDADIYAAGSAGHYSAVYRIPVKTDGSGLDVPIQAAELPGGETCSSILGYLSQIFLGTSVGLRMCAQNSDGSLTVGSVIEAGNVQCLTGYSRFVWFGWTNYDATSTGLGRADVTVVNTDAPAYATDLMASAQGAVTGVVSLGDSRVFAVSGEGVYAQSANLVASGSLDSGEITYDMPDPKIAVSLDVKHALPLVGSHSVSLSADGGAFTALGTHTPDAAETPFSGRNTKAETFQVRVTITRSPTDSTAATTLNRWTLMAVPAAVSGENITVPILLRAKDRLANGQERPRANLDQVLASLKSLRQDPKVFTYQEGATAYRVTMADYEWYPLQKTPDRKAFEGTFVAKLLHQRDVS